VKSRMKRILSGTLAVLFVGQAMFLEDSITPNMMQNRITASASKLPSQSYEYENFRVDCQVTDSWGTTKVISVTITNTGTEPIENWMLYFNPNGMLGDVYDAKKETTAEGVTYIKNYGYNAIIAPNASVPFSYRVENCETLPEQFYMCQTKTNVEECCSVDLHVSGSWNGGFNGEIVISNLTDTPIEAWEITLDTNFTFPTDPPESWGATITNVADYSYRLKGSYTSTIPANQSISLGFTGVLNGTPEISNISMTAIATDEQKINMLYAYDHWDTLTDTDLDALPDLFESEIGTSPSIADTDGDNLLDGYEVLTLGSDPLNMYSFDTVLTDAQYDSDNDGLNNLEEFVRGTDAHRKDSDADGLLDGEEVSIYSTNPALKDTDSDGLYDNDEIVLNLNPLVADTDGDGISDNAEKFEQDMTYTNENADSPINGVSVLFEGTGNILTTTEIHPADTDILTKNVAGLIGEPFSFETTSTFDEATITFALNSDNLNELNFDNLGVLWYNEEYQRFELMETSYDTTSGTISTTVPHFSVYCLVNKPAWAAAKATYYFKAVDDTTDTDADKMPDYYEASNAENPENIFSLANGEEYVSLKDNQDSDNDTICDGEEIILSTVGDANCDGSVTSADAERVQAYLEGSAELTQLEKINADCNLDGQITVADKNAIESYLTNGLYDFDIEDTSKLNFFTIALLTNGSGDLDYDGDCDAADIVLLQDYLLERVTFNAQTYDRADLNLDGSVNAFDLAFMKRWVLMEQNQGDISVAGYNFFFCISNPMSEDTDGDFDLDNADPNPMQYQLNGYFAQKMGEFQKIAQWYLGGDPSSTYSWASNYVTDVWLCFYYIRQLNSKYTGLEWNLTAGTTATWKNKNDFVTLMNTSQKYQYLREYFDNTTTIYADESGNKLDLRHTAATITALLYADGISSEDTKALAGWAGDVRQLMNSAYNRTYELGEYTNIGDAFYDRMGRNDDAFSCMDLYADVDAVNLFEIFYSIYPFNPNYIDISVEALLNQYYNRNTVDRVKSYVENENLNYEKVFYYASGKSYSSNIFEYTFSDVDAEMCSNAYIRYLNDNYNLNIT